MNTIKIKTNGYEIREACELMYAGDRLGDNYAEKIMMSIVSDLKLKLDIQLMRWSSNDPNNMKKRSLTLKKHEAITIYLIIDQNIQRVEHPHTLANLQMLKHNIGRLI